MEVPRDSLDAIETAARQGEPGKILAALAADDLHRLDHREALKRMDEALANVTAQGDDELIGALYEAMIGFTARLVMRVHVLAGPKLVAFDSAVENRSTATNALASLNREILPAIEALHGHALKLATSYASVKRSLRLSDEACRPKSPASHPIRMCGNSAHAPAPVVDVA